MGVPEDMIHDTVDDYPIVRIDKYTGPMGWSNNKQMSVGSANETNHDAYITQFITYANEFIQASGMSVTGAMNVVLSTRNGDTGRDRMKAARRCAAIAPQLRIIRPFFEDRGFDIHVDAHVYTNIWLQFLGVQHETMPCIDIGDPGKIGIGYGDGYHRGFGDHFYIDDLDLVLKHIVGDVDCGIQEFILGHDLCVDVAREFVKDMDLDIKFLDNGIYIYNRQLVVFSDAILIYEGPTSTPIEIHLSDPATTPGRLETILKRRT